MVGFTLIEMYSYQGEKDLGELTSRVRKLQTDGYKNRRGKREEGGNLNRDITDRQTLAPWCPNVPLPCDAASRGQNSKCQQILILMTKYPHSEHFSCPSLVMNGTLNNAQAAKREQ